MLSILLIFEIVGSLAEGVTKCPEECSCPLNEKGYWQVLCMQGGLSDPLPVLKMPPQAEILMVSAPEGLYNSLTLGPIFRGLQNLEEVHVIHSGVPALGEHSFWGLRKLTVLNVSHNSITALLPTNFRGPEELKVLDLSHNKIESTPSAVFRYLKHLKVLNISYNRIPELVPRVFFGLSQLEKLDLSYNPLGDLPSDSFEDVESLLELKCVRCGLLLFPQNLLKVIRNLRSLDLSNNRLTVVPPINFGLKLFELKLDGNHISKIAKVAFKGSPIETLHIGHNRISSIEDESFQNSSLKVLDLSYNRLSVLDAKVLDPIIQGLRKIDLSGNSLHMKQLQAILSKGKQLRELGIGDLGILRLPPDLLRRSRHLRYLNISSNYLSKFPHELLYSTPHLLTLDLSANSFRGLSQNTVAAFSAMSSLVDVRLERNPWQCEDCYISHLLKWLKSADKQPHSLASCKKDPSSLECLKCVGPEDYAGKALILISRESLEKCSSSPSFWSIFESGKAITQSDEPSSSINKRGDLESNGNDFTTVAAFFKDHLALLIGIGCGLILAMMLVVITALACSRKQSAYYYTCEGDKEKVEKLVGRNNNDSPVSTPATTVVGSEPSIKVPPYEPMAISKVHSRTPICASNALKAPITSTLSSKKRPTIATIEEISSLDV